jgi:hypothetical protein
MPLTRKQAVGLKSETLQGSFTAPDATNAAFNLFGASFSPSYGNFERNAFGSGIGQRAPLVTTAEGTIDYTTELVGEGTDATAAAPFETSLLGSGCQVNATVEVVPITNPVGSFTAGETVTFVGGTGGGGVVVAPPSNSIDQNLYVIPSGTITIADAITGVTSGATADVAAGYSAGAVGRVIQPNSDFPTNNGGDSDTQSLRLWQDGTYIDMAGARGTAQLTANVGEPVQMNFSYLGGLRDPGDAAFPTIAYPTVVPPTFRNVKMYLKSTLFDYAVTFSNFTFDLGTQISARSNANLGSGTIGATQILGRTPTITFDADHELDATFPFFQDITDQTVLQVSLIVGTGTNNSFIFTAGNCNITNITQGDRDGLITNTCTLAVNESTTDDDWYLICK